MNEPNTWELPMPKGKFHLLQDVCNAPAPSGQEGAKTRVVKNQMLRIIEKNPSWEIIEFGAHAGIALDTAPGCDDLFTICVMGHLDQIRLLVSSVDSNGKIWLTAAESFLVSTLLGTKARLYVEDPNNPGTYGYVKGTIEAVGAKHIAPNDIRSGKRGIQQSELYFECGLHGDNVAEQVHALGIKAGDSVLMHNPVERKFATDTFGGAYLDNGLGCFAALEIAELVSKHPEGCDRVRVIFAMSAMEEIGRFGAQMMLGSSQMPKIDLLVAMDVGHDYRNAPGVASDHLPPVTLNKGFVIRHGSLLHRGMNSLVMKVANAKGIPYQHDRRGRDPGTDAYAAPFGNDTAAITIGYPIRGMHSSAEVGHTNDLLAAIWAIYYTIADLHGGSATKGFLEELHVDLSKARELSPVGV